MYNDHHQVVRNTLNSKKPADEKTLASLSALEERLDRLKRLSPIFANVSFSEDVERLVSRASAAV